MSDARAEILARLRAAGPDAALPRGDSPGQPARAAVDPASLVERFAREASAVGWTVHGPADEREAAEAVVSILRERRAHALIAWGGGELLVPRLGEELLERNFRVFDPTLPPDRAGRGARLHRLDEADVGITGALGGLADTGSLVLASGGWRPRLAWLLPPMHVALLKLDSLHASLDAFLASRRESVAANSHVAIVTGPSRTGDIEQVLTRGVHGPGVLHVMLVR
jgi:L-lactate dehydrogenase complex protein LldG